MPFPTNASIPLDVKERFSGNCLTVWRETWNDTFERHGDEGRAFATAELAAKNCKEARKSTEDPKMDLAIKSVGPDTVEGLAIPYGPDVDGEQFTADTDLCLDWFGKSGRPALYDHGLDKPGPVLMGRQVDYEQREDGIWAQTQLDRNKRYRKAVDRLIEEGALAYSSGAMPHLVKIGKSGVIERWPWVELSLTPIPAHPGTFVHYNVKSAAFLEHLEDADTQLSIAAVKAIAAGLGSDETPVPESLDEKAGRVSAAVDEFRDHARSAAEMRAKAGRILSAANRERIAKAVASKEAVLAAYGDLEALLAETDPEAADKAADAFMREFLAFQATEARLLGVEVAM